MRPARRRRPSSFELAEAEAVELFHDDERSFARLAVDGHRETYPLRRGSFGAWLARKFYLTFEKVPGAQAVQEALAVLDAKARLGPSWRFLRGLRSSMARSTSISVTLPGRQLR